MNYIDIHTHSFYQEPDTTLVLNVFPEEQEKLDLPVLFSVGLHPWHVQGITWKKHIGLVQGLAESQKVIAIGETGLDKTIDRPYEEQMKAFTGQLGLAESLKKPVIIHCVRAYSEMLAYRKKSDQAIPWIFHWFNADEQIAIELMRKNCYLSFGHMLFKEQSKAYKAFHQIPLERVFFETDDAGVSIREVYTQAANLKNIPVSDLLDQIMNNFKCCFNI